MSSDNFLVGSKLSPSKLDVTYVTSKTSRKKHAVVIYPDDTCKDIYIKLAQTVGKRVSSDMIVAWYKQGSNVNMLGFAYDSISGKDPYQETQIIDSQLITSEGSRIAVQLITEPMSVIIDELSVSHLYFTTWLDYLSFLKLPKKVTDDDCEAKGYESCSMLHGGFIRKYWPRLSQPGCISSRKSIPIN